MVSSISIGGTWQKQYLEEVFSRLLRSYVLLVDRLLLVDIAILSTTRPDDLTREFPLSSRYLRALCVIFGEKKGLVQSVLVLDHRLDTDWLRNIVVETFAGVDGMSHIADYLQLTLERLSHDMNLGVKITPSLQCAATFGCVAFSCDSKDVVVFPKHLLDIFYHVNDRLQICLDKQQDPLSVDKRKDIVDSLSKIIVAAARMDDVFAEQLFEKFIGRPDPALKEYYGELIAMVWKMKLMKKYISKGRMDLRIVGIDTMQMDLVAFFQSKRTSDPSETRSVHVAPVLEFLADVLLEEKITEYIVGVESHPQLISRSSNIVGFLVVTNKFSAEQADLVWKTIISSPDPRVVSATLLMLQNIVKTLTQFQEDVYLCKKLLESPLPAMSHEAQTFFQDFLCVLLNRYQHNPSDVESNLLPAKLCIRLISELSPTRPQGPLVNTVYLEAGNALSLLTPSIPAEERKMLHKLCVRTLQEQGLDAAASVHALQHMAKNCRSDLAYLAGELDVVPALMDEFCAFIENRNSSNPVTNTSRLLEELVPRLDLFFDTVLLDQKIIQEDRTRVFWDHLVGEKAAGLAARDIAWRRLATFAKSGGQNAFLDRCHSDFLPSIQPDYFTPNFFQFIQNITKHKIQTEAFSTSNHIDNQIPGINLVWRVVLTAHPGTGEDSAMEFLVGVYLDNDCLRRISTESVESTHASLVDSCLERLRCAHVRWRHPKSPLSADTMDVTILESDRAGQEIIFRRTMVFLTMFLHAIRKQPKFQSPMDGDVENVVQNPPAVRGDTISIKCQLWRLGVHQAPTREIIAGDLETREELHARVVRLASVHGLSSFRIIWGGTYISLLAKPMESLRDMGVSKGSMMVREPTQNDPQAELVPPSKQPRTAFEKQIVAQLAEFYGLMDSDDMMSKTVCPRLSRHENHFADQRRLLISYRTFNLTRRSHS